MTHAVYKQYIVVYWNPIDYFKQKYGGGVTQFYRSEQPIVG